MRTSTPTGQQRSASFSPFSSISPRYSKGSSKRKLPFSPLVKVSSPLSNKRPALISKSPRNAIISTKRKLPFSPVVKNTTPSRHQRSASRFQISEDESPRKVTSSSKRKLHFSSLRQSDNDALQIEVGLEKSCENVFNEQLEAVLPLALKELQLIGKRETFITFLKLVSENKFPLTNIAFSLWCDVVSWYSTSDTRHMRYSADTLKFFWVGRKLFGGRFVRFMSGMKNETSFLTDCDRLDPHQSKINFACPSENILRDTNPFGDRLPVTFKPGFLDPVIKLKAEKDDGETSYVIMFDGKKVKRGGDVDLLGHEDLKQKPLEKRLEERDKSIKILQQSIDTIEKVQKETNIISSTPDGSKDLVYTTLLGLILLFSATLQSLRTMKMKKNISLEKLKEKAGESDWRKTKFAYSIDSCRTNIYKIENTVSKALKVQMSISEAGASLNKVAHLFADSNKVELQHQENLRILKRPEDIQENSELLDTSVIKQRTEKWFTDRKKMKVTGSTIYKAIGCDSLKRQKEHFDQVLSGVDPPEPSAEQAKAMKHGTESEVHEIATLCGVVMPFLFPDLVFYEEGYYIRDGILVSPDGSMKDSTDTRYAFEGKAPTGMSSYSTPVHYCVPDRYIPQTLFEQRVLQASNGTIYLSWSQESSTVFKVIPDDDLCHSILAEINDIYSADIPIRPKTLTPAAKELKQSISESAKTCVFLGEFPSVYGYLPETLDSSGVSPFIQPKSANDNKAAMTYDDLLKHLYLAKEVLLDTYELERPIASQVVVYLLADLDRLWKPEEPHAIPVTYFFRGYSLSMDVTRKITQDCKQRCKSQGLDIVVLAADGEFNQLMVRGNNGNPLTQHQLSKDIWSEVSKLSKQNILLKFELDCKSYNIFSEGCFSPDCGVKKVVVAESKGKVLDRVKTPSKGWKQKKMHTDVDDCEEVMESTQDSTSANTVVGSEEDSGTQTAGVYENFPLNIAISEENSHDIDSNSLDDTVLYDVEIYDSENYNERMVESGASVSNKMNMTELRQMLILTNEKKWTNVSEESLLEYFRTAESMKKFTVKELAEITKIANIRIGMKMKTSGLKKAEFINQLSAVLCDGSRLEVVPRRTKSKNIPALAVLAKRAINKKSYPKHVLNIAYANYIWPERLKQWRASANVSDKVTIFGLDEVLEPYYIPDKDPVSGEFELFVYDKTHLGSNLRKAICLDKVENISKGAWIRVSERNPAILNSTLIEVSEEGKIVDQMKEKFARAMVSKEVEIQMIEHGDITEAAFCGIIRGALYEAEDTPGIPALERCRKRMNLIHWLQKDVNFGDFPPYGSQIKGLSNILYEGLRSSNEGKLYLYALTKKGTYCARAPNTLCSETFFGTMQEMDPWGQGILSTEGVEKHMSDFITVTAMRMDEDK